MDRRHLAELDAADPLARFRDRFSLPDGVIYLDGNSLGPVGVGIAARLAHTVEEEWGRGLIRSWTGADWINAPKRLGDRIAPLVGARAGEVVVADSTSVNLFKLLATALRLRPDRRVILIEAGDFPTDGYIVQGLIGLVGRDVELRRAAPGEIAAGLDGEVAVMMLSHVNYQSCRLNDMAALTARAHEAGALALWDLCHSVGALAVDLNGATADLAVGCTYKFLNGGPGAPAFLYVAEALQAAAPPTITGWMGHADPFAFAGEYQAAGGILRHLAGTPPILAFAALEAALEVWDEVDLGALREKSVRMGEIFVELMAERLAGCGFGLAAPADARLRGSQITFHHPQGYAIVRALVSQGVIGDFRAPDLLRFGFTPLYLRYADLWDAIDILVEIMDTAAWDSADFKRRAQVT